MAEIEPACQRSLLAVHKLHLVDGKTDVAGPIEGILEIGCGVLYRLQRSLALTPHRLITAQLLHLHGDIPGARPRRAEVGIAFTRPAQPMGKDDEGERALPRLGIVQLRWYTTRSRGIEPLHMYALDLIGTSRAVIAGS